MKTFLTAREAEREALAIIERHGSDVEARHKAMDDLFVQILRQHGYEALCKLFESIEKKYS